MNPRLAALWRALSLFVVIAALVVAVLYLRVPIGPHAAERTLPDTATLLDFFDIVVFGSEFDAITSVRQVRKWSGPVRMKILGKGAAKYRSAIQRHATMLSELTGLTFTEIKPDVRGETMIIWFAPAAEMFTVGSRIEKNAEVLRRIVDQSAGGCYFLSYSFEDGRIAYGAIVVNSERTAAAIRHCLLEEMTQSLGLPNDSPRISPSIFNDNDRLAELSAIDILLVRTLYDSRMHRGLPRAQALERAREIITELVR